MSGVKRVFVEKKKPFAVNAKELLEETETKNVQVSAVDKAKDFLIDLLSENGKIPSNEINQKAEIKNISWASVRRAKQILEILLHSFE